MHTIESNGAILAKHIKDEDISSGLSFFSEDDEFVQVGCWKYDSNQILPPHIHNKVERIINRTCEVLYIIQGKIKAKIYDLEGSLVEELVVQSGEILILLESGHGYEILEDGTKVLEVKNGPYLGAEIDRYRI